MPQPPFVFGRIADKENFVDRIPERERLADNFRSLTNTAIISPRRWGKSSLVQRVAEDITDSDLRVCMIDIFNVRSESDFYAHLVKSVMKATMPKWEEWADAARHFLSQLRPTLSLSPDPTQEFSLELDWQAAQRDPDEVLDLAEKIAESKKLRLVVCIDEFQGIAHFPDALAFQEKLRSHWQHHQHVSYCLYGSKRHMLTDIFSNPDMPFYRFGDIMILTKIDNAVWGDFITQRFADTGKTITPAQGRSIANLVDNHPYYVQQLAQQVWFRTDKICVDSAITTAMTDLTNQLSLVFAGMTESLTARQLNFLRAVLARDPAPSSQRAIREYDLGTSANVTRIKEALVSREIIDIGGGTTEILDPVFAYWLETDYFTG